MARELKNDDVYRFLASVSIIAVHEAAGGTTLVLGIEGPGPCTVGQSIDKSYPHSLKYCGSPLYNESGVQQPHIPQENESTYYQAPVITSPTGHPVQRGIHLVVTRRRANSIQLYTRDTWDRTMNFEHGVNGPFEVQGVQTFSYELGKVGDLARVNIMLPQPLKSTSPLMS